MHSSHRTLFVEIDLSASPIAWWEWDVRRNDVRFNDLKVTCLGYDPADFREGGFQAFTRLVHPDDHALTMQAMHDLLTGKTDIYQTTYRIRNIHGQYNWYLDRGAAIERHGRSIEKVRGLVLDLGSDVREESEVEAVLAMVRATQQDPDSFLSICSVCKRVRVDGTRWTPVTQEFHIVLADRLSHGICPDCLTQLYPEMTDRIRKQLEHCCEESFTTSGRRSPSSSVHGQAR